MRCIANTLSNRTSTTTGPTSFSAWTGCWTILRRSFPRRVARWPADGGCFHSDAGPWHEGIPLEALGAARQVFPADLRHDVDLLLHGRGSADSRGHATRRAVDTSGRLFSFTGRALAHGAGRGRLGRARAPRSHTPVARAGAMVPVRRRLHPAIKLTAALVQRVATGAWPRLGSEAWYVIPVAVAFSTPFQAGAGVRR